MSLCTIFLCSWELGLYTNGKWIEKEFFYFDLVYLHHKFSQNIKMGQNVDFFCFPNMSCGQSKPVSLDADDSNISHIFVVYPQVEKTSKMCSIQANFQKSHKLTLFDRFLKLGASSNCKTFFIVFSVKRYKFRVPTTHIGETKKINFLAHFDILTEFVGGLNEVKIEKFFFYSFFICIELQFPKQLDFWLKKHSFTALYQPSHHVSRKSYGWVQEESQTTYQIRQLTKSVALCTRGN